MNPVVRARGLSRSYGRVRALQSVDVELRAGEIVGLLGPSGAGKTTLVRMVALLNRPDEGSLTLFGDAALPRNLRKFRHRIGYMPQTYALYEDLSARANVAFFGRGVAPDRIDALLDFLGLSERAADAVQTMSGGMKQRVSLACALVTSPELLLLDEPTAGIDPVLRERFWNEFRRVRDEGASLLVSTHQIDEAVHCDRLLILRAGQVVADVTPEELLRRAGTTVRVERADGRIEEQRFEADGGALLRWLRDLDPDTVGRVDVRNDTLESIIVDVMSGSAAADG